MIRRSLLVTALAVPLLVSSCRKAPIESYRIPKEKDPEMPMATAGAEAPMPGAPAAGGMASTPVSTATGAGLTWKAPAAWKEKPATAMRKGSYTIPGNGGADGDLSITAFPGDVGGELANVNRWRGQIQLPPIAAGELPNQVQRSEHDGLKFGIVDIVGTGANPTRILGAYVPFGDATWFFKLMGPDAVVTAAKPDFLAFLQTVQPAAPATK